MENKELSFRKLKADEIDCRIGSSAGDGSYVTVLLYKDARVDMSILDEAVGPANWQREHYAVKGNNYCRVGILIDGQWVWKSDCGKESNSDKEKGEASDSFKRACVNWGIGRELYSAPKIFLSMNKSEFAKACIRVRSIEISDDKRSINRLILEDKDGKQVWPKVSSVKPSVAPSKPRLTQKVGEEIIKRIASVSTKEEASKVMEEYNQKYAITKEQWDKVSMGVKQIKQKQNES